MEKYIKNLRENARQFYRDIGSVYCPYFREKVVFTSEGFDHIQYRKSSGRHFKVQKIRYQLLHLAPLVINNSKTLQEYDIQKLIIKVQHHGRKKKGSKEVKFFGFIAIIRGWKVKVIVRQVGDGKKHFWSIIPNWKTRKSKEGKKTPQNYTGDLAGD